MSELLHIRADADPQIGWGHVVRCLALAESWVDHGGRVRFVGCIGSELLAAQVASVCDEVVTVASGELWVPATPTEGEWLVVDGYTFKAGYLDDLRRLGFRVLVLDDYGHLDRYPVDLLLNQNLGSCRRAYPGIETQKILAGSRYALLRKRFDSWIEFVREIRDPVGRLLVSLGGSDPRGVTELILSGLGESSLEEAEVVVVGVDADREASLRRATADWPETLDLRTMPATDRMPDLIEEADLAIGAAGSSSWERAFLGLPSLLVVTAENQNDVASELSRNRVARNLGWCEDLATRSLSEAVDALTAGRAERIEQSMRGMDLIDGRGRDRVVERMKAVAGSSDSRVRNVRWRDGYALWKLANDEAVRENSFSPEPISLDSHYAWFKKKIGSGSRIWVIESDGELSGQIRYDRLPDGEAEIDVAVRCEYRGKGLGSRLVTETVELAMAELAVDRLSATVKQKNNASANVFLKAGFTEREPYDACRHFELRRAS